MRASLALGLQLLLDDEPFALHAPGRARSCVLVRAGALSRALQNTKTSSEKSKAESTKPLTLSKDTAFAVAAS